MKNTVLTCLLALILAVTTFTSCSKDKTVAEKSINNQTTRTRDNTDRGPAPFTGSVSGKLFPAPASATFIIYYDRTIIASGTAEQKGDLKAGELPAGIYNMKITYRLIGETQTDDKEKSIVISDIRVSTQSNTDLGMINLP
ncbi:MAG: hypothetical protein JNJ86_13780 [Chitinophagaceae bacterium]|jgi:hypothetical protein|nr:hypothetical protein [Chitinophagaceae bacterium]